MKNKLLQFIKETITERKSITGIGICRYLDIYKFESKNELSKEECEKLLNELKEEGIIVFGRLINGYFIKIKSDVL